MLLTLCFVDGEPVEAQHGDFYGGWITHEVLDRLRVIPTLWDGDTVATPKEQVKKTLG